MPAARVDRLVGRRLSGDDVTKRELALAATLLKMASDKFSNHGCNDFDLPDNWTQAECDEFTLSMQTWNGDPQNHEPGRRLTMDYFVMSYLSAKLKEAAEAA